MLAVLWIQGYVDDDAENYSADVLVLGPGHAREDRDAIAEDALLGIVGYELDAFVDLLCAVDVLQPRDQVFDDALVQLVEDIWRDRLIDVRVRIVGPKSQETRLYARRLAGLDVCLRVFALIGESKNRRRGPGVVEGRARYVRSEIYCRQFPLRTKPRLHACNQNLLWVVAHKRGKYGVAPPLNAISGGQDNSVLRCVLAWLQNVAHAFVEEVAEQTTAKIVLFDALEASDGEVADEDLCLQRGFPAQFFWEVADSKIDGVSRSVAKLGELSLVRG